MRNGGSLNSFFSEDINKINLDYEEQLKNLVSKQYIVVKYKKQVTNKQIQDLFKKSISKYVLQVTEGEKKYK